MQNWDYGSNASYYVTICAGGRECYFGEIENNMVKLSEIGILADKYWLEIPGHFKYVKLDEYIIMPNHIHAIIIIDNPNVETPNLGVSTTNTGKNDKWRSGVLGVIINQYKRICTIESRKINPEFAWQSRFHDHVIRDEESLNNIRRYIKDNPENWTKDEFNSENKKNNKTQ